MVRLSYHLLKHQNPLNPNRKSQNWIDSLRVYCKAGHGGNGFPKYGGLGGPGGSVIIKVSSEEKIKKKNKAEPTNLTQLFKKTFNSDPQKQRVEATNGGHSSKLRLNGEKGEDKELIVSTRLTLNAVLSTTFCSFQIELCNLNLLIRIEVAALCK